MLQCLLRGLRIGALYSGMYFCTELLGMTAFWWAGGTLGLLDIIAGALLALFLQYIVFGVALGAVLALPLAGLRSVLPRPFGRMWFDIAVLNLAFVLLAYGWNAESVLQRRVYVTIAICADLLLVIGWLLGRLGGRIARRLRLDARVLRRSSMRVAAVSLVVIAMVGVAALIRGGASRHASQQRPPSQRLPNIVLIVVDTLRRDHLSAYGYGRQTSPNIDQIAAESTLYERAYSTSPWTLPSHASLFTGLFVSSHETDGSHTRLAASKETLAEVLQARGYRTGGFFANPWVSSVSGLDQGFEDFEYLGIQTATGTFFLSLLKGGDKDLGGAAVTDRLIHWSVRASRDGQPFFAFANYMEVHDPFGTVPEPYFSKFLRAPLPRGIGRQWVRHLPLFFCTGCEPGKSPLKQGVANEDPALQCVGGRWVFTPERIEQITALYDAGVLYVDAQIGRIYSALKEVGALDDTVFIVTSDHGESLGEHGRVNHGVFLYEGILGVPLIVRYPPLFPAGLRIEHPVSLVDVKPTLEQIAGLPLKVSRYAGGSLVPSDRLLLSSELILAEYFPQPEHVLRLWQNLYLCDFHPAATRRASLLDGMTKYIWSAAGERELFDLAADPTEERNLIGGALEPGHRLEAALQERLDALRPERSSAETSEIDPATKKALEALGYVQ